VADLLGALRGNVGSSVPRNPGVGGLALLPALGSAGAGARCWSCSPVKELEGARRSSPGTAGQAAGWPWQSWGGWKDAQDCTSVRSAYAAVLGR